MRLRTPFPLSLLVALGATGCAQPGADGGVYWLGVEREAATAAASPAPISLEATALAVGDARVSPRLHIPSTIPLPPTRSADTTAPAPSGECTGALPWLEAPPIVADLTPTDLTPFDHLGMRVAISGPWLVVGVDGDDAGALDGGAVRVWRRDASGWAPSGTLLPTRTAPEEHFGWDVAVHRDRVAVAVPGATVGDRSDAGAVQLFGWREGAGWSPTKRLTAPAPEAGGRFGEALRIGPGRLVIGAPGEHDERGAAYVFAEVDGAWALEAHLGAADALPGDELGAAVAGSGDLVAIGAPNANDGGGAAWVARRMGDGWGPLEPLVPDYISPGARFGGAVAAARELVLVGADQDSPGNLEEAGSVTVFARVDGVWRVRTRLLDLAPAAGAHFGGAIAYDGGVAAVGAWSADGVSVGTGAIMLFAPAKGGWARLARLTDPVGVPGDRLGVGVALGEGVVAAGAWSSDGVAPDAGRLVVFGYGGCDPTEAPASRE